MQANQLLTADLLDILFDGKNKAYGAYDLRKTYNNRLLKAMLATAALLIVLIGVYYISQSHKPATEITYVSPEIDLAKAPDNKDVAEPPPPPPPPPAAQQQVQTERFTNVINIVREEEMNERDRMPPQEDLNNARISIITQDGIVDDGTVSPPASPAGNGNGVVAVAESGKGNGDEPSEFLPVEIESSYPGGVKAWSRFLYKHLGNNYPAIAEEKGIQGTVVIQFIVDVDGTVSKVEAISGPEELREAAVNVIKKSGKWNPAIQNGNKVKSYKRQPITFMLQTD